MTGSANELRPDKIELLGEHLVEDHQEIALDVLGYSSKFALPLGWHYLLDIVWILRELNLPTGAVILDAGAGNGLLQFILADKGYQVISADMMDRKAPQFAHRFFKMSYIESDRELIHQYKTHVLSGRASSAKSTDGNRNWVRTAKTAVPATLRSVLARVLDTRLKDIPTKAAKLLFKGYLEKSTSPAGDLTEEKGSVVYYQCNLGMMNKIDDSSVDAIVSVSALEHNPPEKIGPILDELDRVLKPGADMLLTVSASHPDSGFHEPSHSWLLNEDDTAKTYGLREGYQSNFGEFEAVFGGLKKSKYLKKWLATFYFESDRNGMPWGRWDPGYQPMGIVRRKS